MTVTTFVFFLRLFCLINKTDAKIFKIGDFTNNIGMLLIYAFLIFFNHTWNENPCKTISV